MKRHWNRYEDLEEDSLSELGLKVCKLHQLLPLSMNIKKSEREKIIKSEGLVLDDRHFTDLEDKKIIQNFADFCAKHNIEDCSENRKYLLGLLHSSTDPNIIEQRRKFNKLSKDNYFTLHLAQGLNTRTISQVYQRARKILTPLKKQSQLSEEEKIELVNLYKATKKKCIEIGREYDVDNRSLYQLFRNHMDLDTTNNFQKGRWSFEEEIKLVHAVKTCLKVKKIDLSKKNDIDWVKVSKIVQTRSGSRCHHHWTNQVVLKLPLIEAVLKNEYNIDEEEYERDQEEDNDNKIERKKEHKSKKKHTSKLKSKSKFKSATEVKSNFDSNSQPHENLKSANLKKKSYSKSISDSTSTSNSNLHAKSKSKYKSVSEVESDTDFDSSDSD